MRSFTICLDHKRGRDEQLENISGTDNEDLTSDSEELLSDSESALGIERIDMFLLEKKRVEVRFSLTKETVQPPEKAILLT